MPCGGPGACAFEQVQLSWIAGDLKGLIHLLHEDIVWMVNVDGITVPYASSAVGREDLRWRLQHMMDTFDTSGFDIEQMEHGADACRARVRCQYVHRATGEILDVIVRFTGWEQDGLMVRFEERADAAYVEAFTRFVTFLQANQRDDESS